MSLSKKAVESLLDRIGVKGIIDTLPPMPENVFDLSATNPQLHGNIFNVYPKTLEDVRLLVGSSLSDGENYKRDMDLPERIAESCSLAESSSDTDTVAYDVLYDIACRILHFPCEETEVLIRDNALYKKAVEEIMETAKAVPVLLAQDLVVKDGEVYTIAVPSAVFNTITIYGSGSICFSVSQMKLVANTFHYYPNSKGEN